MKHWIIFTLCLCSVFGMAKSGYSQKRPSLAANACSLPGYTFSCPKGLKVLAKDVLKKSFLARKIEKDYTFGVFIIDSTATSNIEQSVEKDFLPKFFPELKKELRSKEAQSVSTKPMSKFQTGQKLYAVFDGTTLITYAYRKFAKGDQQFFAGSVWKEDMPPGESAELFQEMTGSTEGGCFELLPIVRSITKEKPIVSDEENPCSVTISEVKMNPAK